MINLYPDQQEVIDNLRQDMRKARRILLQSATGSGKTVMASYLVQSAVSKGKKVIFTVPRKELLKQTSQTFESFNIPHGYIAAGKPYNPYCQVYIGMVDTMARRLDKLPKIDLLIPDETHYGKGALNSIIEHYKDAFIVGLSATPWKSSGQGLGCWYERMTMGKSIEWLIENKRLSDYKGYAPSSPDLSKIGVTAGDYSKGQLASFMEEQNVLIGDAVKHYRETAIGRLNIAFCTSIKHSQMVAQSFRDSGIPAMHIDGKTPDDEKRKIIQAYARRELLVLCCCDLLCFGFDLSSASGMDVCIEAMSDLKPTKSLALQMQKWGRVLRYKDYPAIILDHANNFQEHGFPRSGRDWTLKDRKQGKKQTDKAPPTRQCEECFYVHSPSPTCPECGHVYEIKSREVEEREGELEEVDESVVRKQARMEQGTAQSLDDLIVLGHKRGYKNPTAWASKVLAGRMMKK